MGPIVYVERAAGGLQIAAIRLLGHELDERWSPTEPQTDPIDGAQQAAAWIARNLRRTARARRGIALVCVDSVGSACLWLTSSSDQPRVLAAALAQRDGGVAPAADRELLAAPGQALAVATIQALGATPGQAPADGQTPASRRLAVLTDADLALRVLLDALDDRGVDVAAVSTLWQAMASAWDPSSPSWRARADDDRVVADLTTTAAVILVHPRGRLDWCWSHAGEVITAGSMRLSRDRSTDSSDAGRRQVRRIAADADTPDQVRFGPDAMARLSLDWLAWSTQTGRSPARLVCLAPQSALEPTRSDDGPRPLAEALAAVWPGANLDLLVEPDPVGTTLRRLDSAGSARPALRDSPARKLMALSRRPARAHRRLFQWSSAALVAVAAVLAIVGWRWWEAGSIALARAAELRHAAREQAVAALPPGTDARFVQAALRREIDALTVQVPQDALPARPVLAELERLSWVLGHESVRLDHLSLNQLAADMTVTVPDQSVADDLLMGLRSIRGSQLRDWNRTPAVRGARTPGELRYNLSAFWGRREETR